MLVSSLRRPKDGTCCNKLLLKRALSEDVVKSLGKGLEFGVFKKLHVQYINCMSNMP